MPAALAASGVLLGSGVALADEPRNATEPRVMREPGDVTDVIDAFDGGDVFDANISLGFDYFTKSARVLRETSIPGAGLTSGGFSTHLLNVASYGETQARLTPRIDIGLYHDFALHVALPVILTNTRKLSLVDGKPTAGDALLGAPGEQLFAVPFSGPTRSGLEHIAVGIDFAATNQARDETKPTWVIGFEGRFSVGTPMHACNPGASKGQVQCADPSDINRNGVAGEEDEGNFDTASRSPGVTRGTIGIEVHTFISKRMKYIEPYGGFNALFEFQRPSSDYGMGDLAQSLVNHPPIVGTMMIGMQVIPWENREKFARLTFDMRLAGTYHSEGRDYSELFDAIGSTAAPSMRQPQWASYHGGTCGGDPCSVVDPGSQKTYTTGLTDVGAHGSFRVSGSATWRVGEYVKFQFGIGFRHDQRHLITADANCNPAGIPDNPGDTSTSGRCVSNGQSTGYPNPNYRYPINEVGRRYWVEGSNTFDLFANAVVMF